MKTIPAFFYFLVSFLILCPGCGPSAKQLAEQQARQKFRAGVADLKVCTQHTTQVELKEKWDALESCYEANTADLDIKKSQFLKLKLTFTACDTCWDRAAQYERANLSPGLARLQPETRESDRLALAIINPAVTNKFSMPRAQRDRDPDFSATHNVCLALAEIADQCDMILNPPRTDH